MIFRKAISFLVYTNIWISAGAVSFCWLYFQLNELEVDWTVLGFLFFSTLLTYTYQRFEKIAQKEVFHGPRMKWMGKHILLVKIFMAIGIVGSIWMALYLELLSFFLLTILALISFLYAFKFNVFNRKTNLRDIPGIKIYLIGIVWALSCATLPFIESGMKDTLIAFTTSGFFLYVLGITVPFDIRDIELDEYQKKTIPQLVGVRSAKAIAVGLLLSSYGFLTFPHFSSPALSVGILLSIILILFARKTSDELYYSFVLDGLLVVVPIIYYLLHNL